MRKNKLLLLLSALVSMNISCTGESCEAQHFEPTVESLRQYECPEWFRDAKFGIWSCWNAYTVPGQGDWYARNMYIEGSRAYNYHCKTYGHPSEVGYKDVVDLWKGENFNPEEQIQLFKRAGAKYFVAMANHHDNFDLWDSKYQQWNSVNYGPKRDIIAEWRKVTLEAGLRWGITSHLERTWSWFQVNKLADTKGKYKGVPYDGADPKYVDIYLPPDPMGDTSGSQPINATPWWREHWYNRCADLIDNYKPDLFYVDGGVPFPGDDAGATGLRMLAHLYNQNASWHGGENEAVMCLKNWYHVAPKGEWGYFWDGIGTLDFERGRSSEILDEPWQTDTFIGAWTWLPNIKYRSAHDLISELVDVVSKNGNLLVNVTPRPDGTLDEGATTLLEKIGGWMAVNSESIYETRPWLISGTGDLRVVKRGDDNKLIYITALNKPLGSELVVDFLASSLGAEIQTVTLLATGEKLSSRIDPERGLVVTLPENLTGNYAWVFRVDGEALDRFDVERYKGAKRRDVKQDIKIWQAASYSESLDGRFRAIAFDKSATKWAILQDYTLAIVDGDGIKREPYKALDLDFTVSGYAGFIDVSGGVMFRGEGDERWLRVDGISGGVRLSIADDGTLWVVCGDGSLYKRSVGGKAIKLRTFHCTDVACGAENRVAIVDNIGRIRFIDANGRNAGEPAGVHITAIDYSPKTHHLIAVYDGEVALFKDEQWVFTGSKAISVSGGKINDDEIIGWVESEK